MLRLPRVWTNRNVEAYARRIIRKRPARSLHLSGGLQQLEDRALLAIVTVHVYNFDFSTNVVGQPVIDAKINKDDTIHWVFDEGTHTSTSVQGNAESWDSKSKNPGDTFDHKFTTAGTFHYYCTFHGSDNGNGTAAGMSGTITVNASAVLQSIAVTPANPSIVKGNTVQFTATGLYSDSSNKNLTDQVTWGSGTTSVATISTAGLAATLAVGTSTISAALGTVSGSTVLPVTPAILQSIAVTPANSSVTKGQTQQFTATGTYSDSTTLNLTNQVTWASATPAVATISATGLASTIATGGSKISATLGTVTGSTQLTVTPAALQSIAVTPATPSVAKGRTQQFTATGTLSDDSTMDLTTQVFWSSSVTATATITSAGLASTLAIGTSSISATLGTVTGSTILTVTPAVLNAIAITPANPNVPKGRGQQFTATGVLTDGTSQDLTGQVTWTSATPAVATISASGLASTLTTGTSTIVAEQGGVSNTTVLTVSPAVADSIAVTPTNPSIFKGQTRQFTATATLTDDTIADVTDEVTWASGTTSVASINAAGLASSLAVGASSISATLGGVSGATLLTVDPAAVVSIAVGPINPSAAVGTSRQFTATGTYTDDTTQDLTNAVTWASDTPAVATIDDSGLADGLSAGRASISATLGGFSDSTLFTVKVLNLVSIAIAPANPSLAKGLTQQLTATGTFDDDSTQDLTNQVDWSSSQPGIASISTSGLVAALLIGQSTITATRGAISNTTIVTVTPAALLSIAITPASSTLPKGDSRLFTAIGLYTDDTTLDLSGQVAWASNTPAVASISTGGLANALTTGSSSISGTFDGVTGSTDLTVSPAVLRSIVVSPDSSSVAAGETQAFTAMGTYSDETTLNLTNQVTWASDTPAVAGVSTTGLASTHQAGVTSITASLDGVSDSAVLMVTPAALMDIVLMPLNSTVFRGKTQQFMAMGMYSDHSMQDLTEQVTWASSAPGVSTINAAGLATGHAVGSTTISATLDAISETTQLTVQPAALVSISIVPANSNLPKGSTRQFAAVGTFADDTTQDVSGQVAWSSTSPGNASISATGLATALVPGSSTIRAVLGALTDSTTLSVSSATLVSIALSSPTPSLSQGASAQLTATGVYTDSTTQNLTNAVAWVSSVPSVVTVSPAGVATALAAGASSITASLGNVSGSTNLTVTPVILVSISIAPVNANLEPGQTASFKATGAFSDNTTQDLTGQVVWTSSTPGVASINPSGVASAASDGTTSITAAFGSISGTTTLTVKKPVVIVPPNPLFVATGVKIKAKVRKRFNGTVVNFREPKTKPTDFQVTIDWGDATGPSVGRVRKTGNGRYSVTANHVYGAISSFRAVVTIRDAQGRIITAQSSVQVRK